jgi:hypothetical protein
MYIVTTIFIGKEMVMTYSIFISWSYKIISSVQGYMKEIKIVITVI